LPAALGFVARLDQRVGAVGQPPHLEPEPLSVEWLRSTSREMQNIIQLSSPAPLVADSTEAALDLIFGQLLVDPEAQELPLREEAPRPEVHALGLPCS